MDKKPPRPHTLSISAASTKKPRQKKSTSWVTKSDRQMDLHYLANDIKGIIKGITFETSSNSDGATRESYHRSRAYIGVSSVDESRRPRRGDPLESFYRERGDRENLARDLHVSRTTVPGISDSFIRERDRTEQSKSKRISCPWDLYFDEERDDSRSLQLLAKELRYVQGIRDKEVRDLLALNAKLQDEVYDSETEISNLKETNSNLERRMSDMLQVYERIKGNLKKCLTKVKGLEIIGKLSGSYSDDELVLSRNGKVDLDGCSLSSGFNTQSDMSESLSLGPGYEGDGEGSTCADIGRQLDEAINGNDAFGCNGFAATRCDSQPEVLTSRPPTPTRTTQATEHQLFVGRLQANVDSLSQVNKEQAQEIERLRMDLSNCRKHMMTSQFQLEAVEIECSRLLSMEDQLITVITLLQRAREQHVHRQILGDIIITATLMTMGSEEEANPVRCVEKFLREIQEQLSSNPSVAAYDTPCHSNLEGATASTRSALSQVEKAARDNRALLENLKFIDEEESGHNDGSICQNKICSGAEASLN